MDSEQEPAAECADPPGNLLVLALLAPFAGAAAGLIGVIFRLALRGADSLRDTVIGWAHGEAFAGFLFVVVLCGAATAFISAENNPNRGATVRFTVPSSRLRKEGSG